MCLGEVYGAVHKDAAQIEKEQRDLEEERDNADVYNAILQEAFTCCYTKCLGCAFGNPTCGYEMLNMECKCASCKCQFASTSLSSEEEGFCFLLYTCLWLYLYCKLPVDSAEENPSIACLGCRMHHFHHMLNPAAPKEEEELGEGDEGNADKPPDD
jgi:hypothetical protein